MKQLNQESPSIILGNQKWNGADPIFIKRDELIIKEIRLFISKFFNKIKLIKIENKKLIEAIDWVRKYFIEASEESKLLGDEIRGINLNKLISKPIQQPNQELDEIEINVLKKTVKKKNILFELKNKKIKIRNNFL